MSKESRTYRLEPRIISWIEDFAENNDMDKSEVVNRACKVYAAKVSSGDWQDPKVSDPLGEEFQRMFKR